MTRGLLRRSTIALFFVAALAACESSEERAERHYQSGLELMAEGEVERALVELRNVFNLNGTHREARTLYAQTVLGQGKTREAYGQFLLLAEQYPSDSEARIKLSEMAFNLGNFDEFDRHSRRAIELAPEDPRVKAIETTVAYRQAVEAENATAIEGLTEQAEVLSLAQPDNAILRRILIDGYIRTGRLTRAIEALDEILEREPENRALHGQKLAILAQLRDTDGIEAQLVTMIQRFPEEEELQASLLRLYLGQGDLDRAEEFLRNAADPTAENTEAYAGLIQFLTTQRSPEIALAQVDEDIVRYPDVLLLKILRSGLLFQIGERDTAIMDLESALEGQEPGDVVQRGRIALARMLLANGNEVGSRRLVEQVLEVDPTQVDALKLQAGWQIEADETELAIATLRTALDQDPQDFQAMTLMATAYQRSGNSELSREFLGLAAEASGHSAEPALRYATLLQQEDRLRPAEDALISALRVAPGDVRLLAKLGEIYIALDDTGRAEQVVAALRNSNNERARPIADDLQLALLERGSGSEEALNFLENLAEQDRGLRPKIGVVRARILSGDTEGALDYAGQLVAEEPGNPVVQFLLHAAQAAAGQTDAAIAGYRNLLEDDPTRINVWMELLRLQSATGDREATDASIAAALEQNPNNPTLLWAQASYFEQDGDIDGAISIYENLYEQASGNAIIANNLASLLATYRSDQESLDRAFTVGRRLRGSDVPQFQDTFGWISYRLGNFDDAIAHLEPAALALQRDPIVQYHLGKAYLAVERNVEALRQFQRAADVAGPLDSRAQILEARDLINQLQVGADALQPEN